MKNYKVVTEFSVLDRATAQLNKMASQGNVAAGVLGRGISQAQTRVSAFGATISSALTTGIKVGVGAVAAGLAVATKQYAEFDEAIRSAAAAYGPAFTQADNFESKLKDMGRAVRNVAAATEFDAVQAGNAMKTLAQAGVQSEQAIALLPGVADLATTALTGMDEAVGLAVGSLNVMGMMSDKPEELARNMTRISDVMAYTANSAYMSLQDVGAAISAGGSFFKTANNDLNVMSGSLTALANNSIKGAEAGTALRNIMTNLSAPTSRADAALKAMNITTTDAAGNLLPLPKIIGQFNKAMAGMGDAEKNANIYDIFGKQNIAAVTALLNTGEEALNSYALAAANSAGTAAKGAEVIRGGLTNQLKVLVSGLTELGFKFVEAFETRGSNGLKKLTEAISSFDPQPLINAAINIVDAISEIVRIAWKFRGVIIVVMGIMIAWKTAMTLAAIGMNVATAAQWLWNAALSANPIGIVIAAIVALIGIIIVLTGKWQEVSAAVDGFFERIRNMKGIGGAILKILVAPLELVWNAIRGIFDTINAFKAGGFIEGLKMLGLSILQMIAAPIQAILEALSWIPGLGWLHDKISGFFEETRASILAGSGAAESGGGLPAESETDIAASMMEPTRSAAVANNYSREESVTTNRVEIGLSDGLTVKSGATAAPAFTLRTGRR